MNDLHDLDDDDAAGGASGDTLHFTITPEVAGAAARLDKALALLCPDLSRTRLKGLIEAGQVYVNGKERDTASTQVAEGDHVTVTVPPPVEATPKPENIPLDIVYEDEHLLVINKHAGLVVHPGAGNHTGTLVNALLHHCGDSLSGIGGVLRPGIVHRLDKETSGLMLVAKSDVAHRGLAAQLADRTLSRRYRALVWKIPMPPIGRIDISIGRHPANRLKMAAGVRGGREAATFYKITKRFGDSACEVECSLESGRTHQVRVHMAHIGHPLLGDPLYGLQTNAARALLKKGGIEGGEAEIIMNFPRQALHAWAISFVHPVTEEEMSFESALPDDLIHLHSLLNSIS